MSLVPKLLLGGAGFIYGLVGLASFTFMAFRDRALLFRKRDSKQEDEFASFQKIFWDLSKSPPGLEHRFFTTRNGVKLHYVLNSNAPKSKNVTVFVHGFPDNWLLWRNFTSSSQLSAHSILVAVDLPGFGGSDSLPRYDPDHVLEAVTEFILYIREQHLQPGGKALVVSHDWGGIIAARLASEAPQLADRFIISSAPIPLHFYSNVEAHAASSKQMLRTWLRHPFSLRLLKRAIENIYPVYSQIRRSTYIFVFNLPKPLANFVGTMGDMWFLRLMREIATGIRSKRKANVEISGEQAAEFAIASTEPGTAETSFNDGDAYYAAAVKSRIPDGGWSEKIRIYREGLFRRPWEKSLETIIALSDLDTGKRGRRLSSTGAGLFEDGPPGSLKAPATIVFGKSDFAFEMHICLDGISEYLVKDSQVVVLEKGGHWLPYEEEGRKLLESVIVWALEENRGPLKTSLEGLEKARIVVEK